MPNPASSLGSLTEGMKLLQASTLFGDNVCIYVYRFSWRASECHHSYTSGLKAMAILRIGSRSIICTAYTRRQAKMEFPAELLYMRSVTSRMAASSWGPACT